MIDRYRLYALLAAVTTLASSVPSMAADRQSWLLALSKTDHVMAIVDPVTLKTVARVPVGPDPDTTHMIYVSPDTTRIAATNVVSGTVSIFEHQLVQPTVPPTGVLPLAAKPRMDWVQTLVPVGKGAEGFDVSPDGRELWTATPAGIISVLNLDIKTVVARIDSGVLGLHRMKFTPDGRHILLVSVRTEDLLIYDTTTQKEIKRLKIGRGASMMIDAIGNRAFISCTPDNYIEIIDLGKFESIGRLDIGGRPDGVAMSR